ncbi:hypothetical protein GCM10029976_084800 [Kribbella albertanoniae]
MVAADNDEACQLTRRGGSRRIGLAGVLYGLSKRLGSPTPRKRPVELPNPRTNQPNRRTTYTYSGPRTPDQMSEAPTR